MNSNYTPLPQSVTDLFTYLHFNFQSSRSKESLIYEIWSVGHSWAQLLKQNNTQIIRIQK